MDPLRFAVHVHCDFFNDLVVHLVTSGNGHAEPQLPIEIAQVEIESGFGTGFDAVGCSQLIGYHT